MSNLDALWLVVTTLALLSFVIFPAARTNFLRMSVTVAVMSPFALTSILAGKWVIATMAGLSAAANVIAIIERGRFLEAKAASAAPAVRLVTVATEGDLP